jgi:hypothetical protein
VALDDTGIIVRQADSGYLEIWQGENRVRIHRTDLHFLVSALIRKSL